MLQSQEVGRRSGSLRSSDWTDPRCPCTGQYDPRVVAPQTETVELNADLVERAQREADKRGIALKQFVDEALTRWLAIHHGK